MLETAHLVLDKAKESDWQDMYNNVWSSSFCNRYMFWDLTLTQDGAQERIKRNINYQKLHPYSWFIYLKENHEAIGFFNMHICGKDSIEEGGLVIAEKYAHRGLGTEVLTAAVEYAFNQLKMKTFIYYCDQENTASIALAEKCGFTHVKDKIVISPKDNSERKMLIFEKYSK